MNTCFLTSRTTQAPWSRTSAGRSSNCTTASTTPTYVKGANTALDKLAEARASGKFDSIVGLEKSLAFNLGGHVLHSMYWANLSPDGGDKPVGDLAAAIDEQFGSFDAFKAHITEATNTRAGLGLGHLLVGAGRPEADHRATRGSSR